MSYMDKWNSRWKNFEPHEVLSPQGLKLFNNTGIILVRPEVLDFAQKFRDKFGETYINHKGHNYRGFRTFEENLAVYKRLGLSPKKFSMHTFGLAIDISCDNASPEQIADYAKKHGASGVGIYPTFCHVDFRHWLYDNPARWNS